MSQRIVVVMIVMENIAVVMIVMENITVEYFLDLGSFGSRIVVSVDDTQIKGNTYTGTKYTWTNRELRRNGKLGVGSDEQLRTTLVTYFHCDPIRGHSSVQVTIKKMDLASSHGLLQPLPIPTKVWHDIPMDFIEALPPSQDGQTEIVNKCVECFMRCMTGEKPKEWFKWVSLTEYWYNTNFHSSAHTTPFEIVYGQAPNLHLPYLAGTSSIEKVDKTMQAREQAIAMLQFHLKRSQERMKNMVDKNRSDRSFEVGIKVYMKLQPYRKVTTRQRTYHKFSAKFYGPFLILAKIMKVAYKLQLPENSQIHPVFHVSQLKLCKGTNHQVRILPQCGLDEVLSVEPEAIIGKRLRKLHNKVVLYVIVKWVNQAEENTTWELYIDLIQRLPFLKKKPDLTFFHLSANKSTIGTLEDSEGTEVDDAFFFASSWPIGRTSRTSFSFESSASLLRLKPPRAESMCCVSYHLKELRCSVQCHTQMRMWIVSRGIQIHQSPRGIFINQVKYAQEIQIKHGMTSCDSVGTLMATKHLDADLSGTPVDQMKYRSMLGALMYLTASRPDIMHATCYCACYQAKPTEKHLIAVKRMFRYLKIPFTWDFGIQKTPVSN
nr:retrotransposable element Tf2 [Tanacetum cinerariifolium]